VTLVALLAAYGGTVLIAGPVLLRRTTLLSHAPRWAVAAVFAAIGSAFFSVAIAVLLTVIEVGGHWILSTAETASCLMLAIVLIAVALVVIGRPAVRLASALRRTRDSADAHASGVRLVGRRLARDVVVLDSVERAAYCVAGRTPTIVVTTAALEVLDDDELAAVLAHERAHLRGRHAFIIAVVRGLAAMLPTVGLVRAAAARIPTLLEMSADDVAARGHGRDALLSGLLALSHADARPGHQLAAAEVAVLARAERLAAPRSALTAAGSSAVLSGTVAMMLTGPMVIAVIATAGALWCY
jgi:Zn-dependent protease with chaperone function